MIRWCSYCQAFLGEVPPYDEHLITHGICIECDARLDGGEDLRELTADVRRLMDRVFDCAVAVDEDSIPGLLAEATQLGLSASSVLVGLLQPALYRAGDAWRDGRMSVAEEHRLTGWCDRFFAHLTVPRPRGEPIDLLVFLAPGNTHTLGPRFAAAVLASRGLSTEVIVPELGVADMVREVDRLRPRIVGVSCALPASVRDADRVCAELERRVAPAWQRRFLLGGYAFRTGAEAWTGSSGARIVVTFDEAERAIRGVPGGG